MRLPSSQAGAILVPLYIYLSSGPILGDYLYSHSEPTSEILNLLPGDIRRKLAFRTNDQNQEEWRSQNNTKKSPALLPPSKPLLFLHASRFALHVSSQTSLTSHIQIFISPQRFKAKPHHGRVTLGVTAPLPTYFIDVCEAAGLTTNLSDAQVQGGVDIDGEPLLLNETGMDDEGVLQSLGGRWFGGHQDQSASLIESESK